MTPTNANVLMQAATCIRSCIPAGMMRAVEIGIVSGPNIRPIYPCGEPGDCIALIGSGSVGADGVYVLTTDTGYSYIYLQQADPFYRIEHFYVGPGVWYVRYISDDVQYSLYCSSDANSAPCNWVRCDLGVNPAPTGSYVACVSTDCIQIYGPASFPDVVGVYENDGTGVFYNTIDPALTLEPCPEFGGAYGICGNHLTAFAYYTAVNFPYTWQVQLLDVPVPTGDYVVCEAAQEGLVIGGDQIVIGGVPVVVH